MFTLKKYALILTLYFITTLTLLPFGYLRAKEELKKKPVDRQKTESKQKQTHTQNQPRISFDSQKYDAGVVWEGDEVVHTFIVKNTGTTQLDIKNVKPG